MKNIFYILFCVATSTLCLAQNEKPEPPRYHPASPEPYTRAPQTVMPDGYKQLPQAVPLLIDIIDPEPTSATKTEKGKGKSKVKSKRVKKRNQTRL